MAINKITDIEQDYVLFNREYFICISLNLLDLFHKLSH